MRLYMAGMFASRCVWWLTLGLVSTACVASTETEGSTEAAKDGGARLQSAHVVLYQRAAWSLQGMAQVFSGASAESLTFLPAKRALFVRAAPGASLALKAPRSAVRSRFWRTEPWLRALDAHANRQEVFFDMGALRTLLEAPVADVTVDPVDFDDAVQREIRARGPLGFMRSTSVSTDPLQHLVRVSDAMNLRADRGVSLWLSVLKPALAQLQAASSAIVDGSATDTETLLAIGLCDVAQRARTAGMSQGSGGLALRLQRGLSESLADTSCAAPVFAAARARLVTVPARAVRVPSA